MSGRFSRAVLIASFALSCSAVLAAVPDADGDSEWQAYISLAADPGSTPASPVGPTTPEGGFSAPERVSFGEKMRERVLDQLCRNVRLRYEYNLPGDFGGTGTGFKRWLAPRPDGRLTVIDEETLRVGYSHAFSEALGQAAGAAVALRLGGSLEGSSMVIRPLEGKATCKELDTLVDLRDIKTILPLKGERIAAMKIGELWRLPFRLTVGHAETLSDAAAENLNISLSFNGAETGAAALTIYRLSESALRFRFRVDRVEVRTKGGQIAETIPAAQFASLGADILSKFIDREAARRLKSYTAASLGFEHSSSHGKRVLLEYVVDPRDPAQAEAVAAALHGDFESLVKMGWRMSAQQATDENVEAAYLRMKAEHDAQLGEASYAAINAYARKAELTTLNLPLLTAQNWATLQGDDTTARYGGEGGEYHFEHADKSRASEYVILPFVGPMIKDNVQRDVQVVTQAKAGEAYGDPIVVYIQQHGFLRTTESSVRETAAQFSDIMALAGTHGNGANPRLALPLAQYFPVPPPAPEPDFGRPIDPYAPPGANQEPSNRNASIAFTLVFNQEAVKQLMAATSEDIVKSYAAVADSPSVMNRFLCFIGCRDEKDELRALAQEASGLVADLLAVRNAPDNESRSAALAKAFGGLGQSGLSYDRALRVFVQLVDPMDLTADFVAVVDRPKGKEDLALHYVLKRDRPDNELLRSAGEAKSRFAEPSILMD